MKQDKRPAGAAVKKRRFFNRISRKLMLFVVLMSMVLLALVWLLSVKLLEPMYNRRVLADLNHAADVYSAIIEKYGKFESFDKSGGVHIPSDMMEEIMDNRGLLAGKCFEVAGTDCKVLLHLHQLQSDQCLLHPNPLRFSRSFCSTSGSSGRSPSRSACFRAAFRRSPAPILQRSSRPRRAANISASSTSAARGRRFSAR